MLAMALDVLTDRALNKLGLLEPSLATECDLDPLLRL